jgi:hypothetical protein
MVRPVKYTVEELEKKVNKYFASKAAEAKKGKKKLIYTGILDLCRFLDITWDTWENYRNRPVYSDITKRAETKIRANWIEQLFFPGRNAAGAMFWLKNNAGWADKQEIQHTRQIEVHAAQLDQIPGDTLQKLISVVQELREEKRKTIDVTPEENPDGG